MIALPAAPGDVLAVSGAGIFGKIIRFGEKLAGKDPGDERLAGHVAIVTHQDRMGRWIGIQGEPGGVSLCDCTPYLADPRTSTNHAQPKPDGAGQLGTFLASCAKSVGVKYDWVGIAADAEVCLHAPDLAPLIERLWRWPSDKGLLPGHVVCSSLAAMLYDLPSVGWKHPDLGTERICMPADWSAWNTGRCWQ